MNRLTGVFRADEWLTQAIQKLAEDLEIARQRAEMAGALLEELQRGICPAVSPHSRESLDRRYQAFSCPPGHNLPLPPR